MVFRKKKKETTCAAPANPLCRGEHAYLFTPKTTTIVFTCVSCGHSIVIDA